MLKTIKNLDELADYIKDINGSFRDPNQAMAFLKPCMKRRIFSNIFKKVGRERNES